MSQFVSQALQSAKDQTEKAAIIAEAAFSLLPEATALVARRCVILHWFDQLLVETMLEDSELTLDEMRHAYEQLATLPFIDSVPWGLTFQNVTREGLLRRYVTTQPELLQTAARLAAPAYEMQEEDKKSIAEAFYCYLVAGDQESATALQQALFVQASSNQDWQFVNNLLQLQAEAERLPFVRPLPRQERQLLLQGLVHRIQGKREAALLDYTQALDMNPSSILAYVSRGTTYVEQKSYDKALADYNTASRIDRNFAPTYLSRSVVYTKQRKYREALKENDRAVQLGLNTNMVYINKANILNELGQYEDALTACDTALQINQNAIEAYIGKGQALNGLENYNEALSAYEKALLLNPDAVDAYVGKGKALNGLKRYTEALEACNIAIKLNPNSADAYRVQAYAYRNLMQYELASEANRWANELDPIAEEEIAHEDVITDKGKNKNTGIRKRRERSTNNNQKTVSFLGNITRVVFRPTQGRAQERAKTFRKSIENSLAVAIVIILILAAIALFPAIRSTIGGYHGVDTTATAQTQAQHLTATSVINQNMTATAIAIKTKSTIPKGTLLYSTASPGAASNTSGPCDNSGEQWVDYNQPIIQCQGTSTQISNPNNDPPDLVGTFLATLPSGQFSTSNYVIEAQLQQPTTSNADFGVYFRNQPNNQQGVYTFLIHSDGTWHAYVYNNTKGVGTQIAHGNFGNAHAAVTIGVVANGSNFTFYANGQELASINNSIYPTGTVGIAVDAGGMVIVSKFALYDVA